VITYATVFRPYGDVVSFVLETEVLKLLNDRILWYWVTIVIEKFKLGWLLLLRRILIIKEHDCCHNCSE
jgi:hypothetical protein